MPNPKIRNYKQQRHAWEKTVPYSGIDRLNPTEAVDTVETYYNCVNVGNEEKEKTKKTIKSKTKQCCTSAEALDSQEKG